MASPALRYIFSLCNSYFKKSLSRGCHMIDDVIGYGQRKIKNVKSQKQIYQSTEHQKLSQIHIKTMSRKSGVLELCPFEIGCEVTMATIPQNVSNEMKSKA